MTGIKVAVLLAAYNGMKWINEQIQSVLNQENVSVDIHISVDVSTDGTYENCLELAKQYSNIYIFPYGIRYGGAARNFYRLVRDVELASYDFVSFADQDDIWYLDKLSNAIKVLSEKGYDCYSSNVIAFWENGKQVLISKAQDQVEYDYCFESAGPGCTYVFSKEVALKFQAFISNNKDKVDEVELHDWLIYAFARHSGYKWFIDSWPSMLYRQHSSNQFGANGGLQAAKRRIQMIRDSWYLTEVKRIVNILDVENRPFFVNCLNRGYFGHLYMACYIHKVRRKLRDRLSLAVILVLGMLK
ncbi:rhamnosyltransferase [Xenorhabdus cabanillasii]|uniref:Rhamnosyltransferase n=1 Tax=Xenorhabdus cabanillasii TaxID=351673 RepID=A0A3D9UBB7_9GAMM|nr:glycosyltransferase [Xenorhabdus cabanillasii]REF25613.1 rhamnosyltransferase [Xenorhabdus cabanillasii]